MSCSRLSVRGADIETGLAGLWRFDDPANLTKADQGQPLVLTGSHQAVSGIDDEDGAARIGIGSYYRCAHGISPNGSGQYVNEWSLVIDFRYPATSAGQWMCFYQTSPSNGNDGDCFIRSGSGTLGVSATGYSALSTQSDTWYRMVVSVDNGSFYRIYINGIQWLEGSAQAVDGRFSLDPELLLFADENGEDYPIDVSLVALYDRSLTADDAAALRGPGGNEVVPPDTMLLTKPYLQNVQPDGITVMWELTAEEVCRFDYGLDGNYGMEGQIVSLLSGAGTLIYKTALTDLNPATVYQYRLTVADQSYDGSFVTAPLGRAAFTFGVWSDSQGTNHDQYPVDPYEPTRKMMAHMADRVDFGVTVGDLAENGASYGDTRVYYLDRVAAYLGQKIPWFVAWGNHDQGSTAVIRQFHDLPSQLRGGEFTAGYGSYSFEYAGCHFLCIDDADRSDMAWVESDLRRAWTGGARFIFVFVHRPPFLERWYEGEEFFRENLVPLLEKYGVDVCFSGHMHGYERGHLNGVYYCVTGGGSWLDLPEPLVRDWPHMTVGGYNDLAPGIDGGLVNEYVTVTVDALGFVATMIPFYPDGSVMPGVTDTFGKTDLQADINRDGKVDLDDLIILTNSWLRE